MTREEAVERIKMILEEATANEDAVSYVTSDDADALDMAIKALEPCEDCVSRQEVIGLFALNADAVRPYSQTWEEVKTLPPVTPTHKKGKWVTKFHGFPPEPLTVCSECGFDKDYTIRPRYFHKINFCPNCGAEMESENKKSCDNCIHHTDADEIHGITPCGSCGVEKKNFEQKTEMESEE